jgi:copper transport protein
MSSETMRRLALGLGLTIGLGLALALLGDVAHAQGLHRHHSEGQSLSRQEVLGGIAHGVTLAATTLLAGIVAFAALVWLPVSRSSGAGQDGVNLFVRLAWVLLGVLVAAALAEVSLYAVLASNESLSLGLFWEALTGTRVGGIWLARLGFSLLVALSMTFAARGDRQSYWLLPTVLATVPLLTLTQLSHAAAEGRFLPFFADWLHATAASAWMGGLLGFSALLIGPLRKMPAETRMELLGRAVPRFSTLATLSVVVLLITGIYASLLHVPSFSALIGTPYGRALIMKLGMVALILPIGAINLMDRGRNDSFGRMVGAEVILALGVFIATGFLTGLTPPP